MSYRIGWLTPLTPKSGIGTFSKAILDAFPTRVDGEDIDVTVLYVDHETIYPVEQRAVRIGREADFRALLGVFDLLVYNIGNNREHHEPIFELLRVAPGIVVCHDYVYQHYLADRAARTSRHFACYAALMHAFSKGQPGAYLRRSQVTSRTGRIRYSPWDAGVCTQEPLSEALVSLGSAVVVHSAFSRRHVERSFVGPILELGMPHDVRRVGPDADEVLAQWRDRLSTKPVLDLVSFGHVQSAKCIDLVLEAIAASPKLRRRVRYTIAGFVGDETYLAGLRDMVRAERLEDVVAFELGVPDARLTELMRTADVFLNLRRPNTEAASLSLVEQLDTGRPVVALASGCYAEVPDEGALKLPPDVRGGELARAMEQLVDAPKAMIAMGQAGRRFARRWTSRAYAETLVRFALRHRRKLAERGRAFYEVKRADPPFAVEDGWLSNLAKARSALIYFDRNLLQIDPGLIKAMPHHELCAYVCEVILGVFHRPSLQQALSRFFVRLDASQTYWACVTFALVAEAVFGGDETAVARLVNGRTFLDPEFWSVLERLPAQQMFMAAAPLIARRAATSEELSLCGRDDEDGYPARCRFATLLAECDADAAALEPLRQWAHGRQVPKTEVRLAMTEAMEMRVGSQPEGSETSDAVVFSGFHELEPDRIWTRGERAFVGLRLGAGRRVVEVTVEPLHACAEQPNEVSLAYGELETRIELHDTREVSLRLALDVGDGAGDDILWLELATTRAGRPKPPSVDARILGVSLHMIRVSTPAEAAAERHDHAIVGLNEMAARMRTATHLGVRSASVR